LVSLLKRLSLWLSLRLRELRYQILARWGGAGRVEEDITQV
jgi:hypothetical protein